MKLKLELEVEYDPNHTSKDYLMTSLHSIGNFAAGNGLLTGESDAEVNTWETHVTEIEEEVTCKRQRLRFS